MGSTARFYIYIAILIFAFVSSLVRFGKLDTAFKYLSVLLGLTLSEEIIAHILARTYGNNMIVFHIYSPLLLILTSAYYHHANPVIRKYKIAFAVAVVGTMAAIGNTIYLQPLHVFNTNYLLFVGFCVIAMALMTFYHFYVDSSHVSLLKHPDFRVSLVLLFYWSSTFISFAFHEVLEDAAFHLVYLFIWAVNLITYAALGLIFSLYSNTHRHAR
ncbi:MAG: hypothetical protein EOP56_02765 [Sphingobacteriales bacterium]|nr:MAG: hypothetical protein EOP56_02765 [Sphingobacteriales bacterium]